MTATLAAPRTASAVERPDTGDMIVIHNVFRRLFGALPGVIRDVTAGDLARAAVVSKHVVRLTGDLHHHHTTEDEMLWPVLLDRVELHRDLVIRAERQHEHVHELLEQINVQVVAFRRHAATADRDVLAATVAELDASLREHMADEEGHILPLVEEYLSIDEWEAVGGRARANTPPRRQIVLLGWILDTMPTDERERFMHDKLPLPARVVWPLIGPRMWARERDSFYGR